MSTKTDFGDWLKDDPQINEKNLVVEKINFKRIVKILEKKLPTMTDYKDWLKAHHHIYL